MAADQAKLKKRLELMLKQPENLYCADCKKRGPRWASANLGIFMCIECSGIHRSLGVHISFVRSVNLDSWTKQQVDFMEEWGNQRANEYYEANLPANYHRPKEGDPVRVVEKFIREKYEHKKFISKSMPPPKTASAAASQQVSGVNTPVDEERMSPAPGNMQFREDSPAPPAAYTTRTQVAAPKPAPAPVNLLDFDSGVSTSVHPVNGTAFQTPPALPDVPPPCIPTDVFSGFGAATPNSNIMQTGNSPYTMQQTVVVPATTAPQHTSSGSSVNSVFSDFSNFNNSTVPTPPPAANDIFAAFSTPASAQPAAVAPQQAKPNPLDIMSLYNTGAPQSRGGMMMNSPGNPNMNNMGGMNMGGMNMGGNMGNMGGSGMMNNPGMMPQQRGSMVGMGMNMPMQGVNDSPHMNMMQQNNAGIAAGGYNMRSNSPMPNPGGANMMGGAYGVPSGNPSMMFAGQQQNQTQYPGMNNQFGGMNAPNSNNNLPVNAFAGFGNVGSGSNKQQW